MDEMDRDMEVVRSFVAGDRQAFSTLMERYSGLCRYYLQTHFRLDEQVVQDLTQEAFLKVFQALPRLRPDSRFKSWFITIVRNVALDHVRKFPPRANPLPIDAAHEIAAPGTGDQLKRLVILEMADRLPGRQREVLTLFYFWELTSAEIGAMLGVPEGTVRSDLRLARLRLAELLESRESL
jgi:RNA polymerase sigma factor (sigma-70 family)